DHSFIPRRNHTSRRRKARYRNRGIFLQSGKSERTGGVVQKTPRTQHRRLWLVVLVERRRRNRWNDAMVAVFSRYEILRAITKAIHAELPRGKPHEVA